MKRGIVWDFIQVPPQRLEQVIRRVPPVQQLPEVNPGGIKPVGLAGIRIEEDRPVVKLFPQDDHRVGDGFIIRFQKAAPVESPPVSPDSTSRTEQKRFHGDPLSGA